MLAAPRAASPAASMTVVTEMVTSESNAVAPELPPPRIHGAQVSFPLKLQRILDKLEADGNTDIIVAVQLFQRGSDTLGDLQVDRVFGLGAVDGDGHHAIAYVYQYSLFFTHFVSPLEM